MSDEHADAPTDANAPAADLSWLPDAHWGSAETPLPPIDDGDDDPDPDDELLPQTPADVIAMLGFDPLEFASGLGADEAAWKEADHPRAPDGKFGSGGGGANAATQAFGKTGKDTLPDSLGGVAFSKWTDPPKSAAGWKERAEAGPEFSEPPPPKPGKGKNLGAGVIIKEDDGRVWLIHPTAQFGDVAATFPKGGTDGEDLRGTALKECYEESGLQVELTGFAGDVERSTSTARYYFAKRTGGSPADHGWESEGVSLVSPDDLADHLNHPADKKLLGMIGMGKDGGGKDGGGRVAAVPTADWEKVGKQLGSNPGGRYRDETGNEYYSKRHKSEWHARNEVLAGQLYKLAGSPAVEPMLTKVGEGYGSATPWMPGVKTIDPGDAAQRRAAQANFATHAWLANWDAAGLTYDNQGTHDGRMKTLDVGGSLDFRAQGGPKGSAFGKTVPEVDTLRDQKTNAQSARVYGEMSPADLAKSAKKVTDIPDAAIRDAVEAHGSGTKEQRAALADKLIARRDHIAKRLSKWEGGEDAARVRKWPRGWFGAADAEWEEGKHPREQDGKFTSGGGGASSAAETIPAHNQPKFAALKKIHAMASKALTVNQDPHAFAHELIQAVQGWKHSTTASYANKVLAHVEQAHGLPKGALGKAAAQGGTPTWPKGGLISEQTASPPPPASAPKHMTEMDKIAKAADPAPVKLNKLFDYADKNYSDMTLAEQKHAAKLVAELEAEEEMDTSYADDLPDDLDENPEDKPAPAPVADLPQPHPDSKGQKAVHAAAQTAGSMEDKAAAIKAAIKAAPSSFPTSGYALKYANELLGAIGSKQQISDAYALAGEKTAAQMMAEQDAVPSPAKKVKPEVKPGERAAAFEHMQPLPGSNAADEYANPSAVYEAHPTKKVQRALDVMKEALKVSAATDETTREAVPSLSKTFWSKIDPAERSAVKGYCDSSGQCHAVNATLRPNKQSKNPEAIAQAQRMDDAFEADGAVLKKALVVRRGETVPQEEIEGWIEGLSKGLPVAYQKHGFISTSAANRPAFSGNVWFHMAVPKGGRALGVHTVSTHKGENEIMLRHGQAFTMVAIEKVGSRYHAYMTAD